MKLISMTDFVLEQQEIWHNSQDPSCTEHFVVRAIKYAEFLKQPLNIDMFKGDNVLFDTGECEVLMLNNNPKWLMISNYLADAIVTQKASNVEAVVSYGFRLTPLAVNLLSL